MHKYVNCFKTSPACLQKLLRKIYFLSFKSLLQLSSLSNRKLSKAHNVYI